MLVPHPDDPEYGCAAAVAKWTSQGKHVHYALACRGEVGIPGMPPEDGGPTARTRTTAFVGDRRRRRRAVLGLPGQPDPQHTRTPAKIAETITEVAPDVVITLYSGPEWAPGAPNQRDHIEFSNAVAAAYDSLPNPPRWLFENGPHGTHGEVVDGFVDVAVASLAAHDVYLSVSIPTRRS